MAAKRPTWRVERDAARLRYAFFLSHVNEEQDLAEVKELKKEIDTQSTADGRRLRCFLDIDDWPLAHEPTLAMREGLVVSNDAVLWITPRYLDSTRGWTWMELALAEVLELDLSWRHIDEPYYFLLPVFWHVTLEQLTRTPLVKYWQRGLVRPDEVCTIAEVASRLIRTYWQEEAKRVRR